MQLDHLTFNMSRRAREHYRWEYYHVSLSDRSVLILTLRFGLGFIIF